MPQANLGFTSLNSSIPSSPPAENTIGLGIGDILSFPPPFPPFCYGALAVDCHSFTARLQPTFAIIVRLCGLNYTLFSVHTWKI